MKHLNYYCAALRVDLAYCFIFTDGLNGAKSIFVFIDFHLVDVSVIDEIKRTLAPESRFRSYRARKPRGFR